MEIINLDMTPSTVTPNAHAGQYDASRTVRFMLKNGGVPFTLAGTETITAEITRSDNTEVTVNVANTSSNYVDVVFDDTVCTVKGLYACELRLKDSGGFDIGSKNFALLVQRDPYDGAGVVVETVGPADICTFETTLPDPLQSVTVDVEATGGNGTPDNPNPIIGYSSANVTRCGVNLFDKDGGNVINAYLSTKIEALAVCRMVFAKCNPSTQYTVSKTAGQRFIVAYTKKTPDINVNIYGSIQDSTASNITITTGADAKYIVAMVYNGNVDTGTADEMLASVQIAEGTDTTYHAYNGQTYTIAFGQTVYGGQLDVTRGKLHVTHERVKINDPTLTWYYTSALACFNTTSLVSVVKGGNNGVLCECESLLNVALSTATITANDNFIRFNLKSDGTAETGNFGVGALVLKDTAYSDVPSMLSALGDYYVLYELATPFDIDLTPEVISAIVGVNNVFADCGQTTVKYLKAGA